jgi:toxin ParE1/3/4
VKWRVLIRPRAEADLREARNWYETQRAGLGDEFLADMSIALKSLAKDPQRYPDYYRGFRRVLTRRFPYKIFYRVEGDRVIAFRVLHARRDHAQMLRRER